MHTIDSNRDAANVELLDIAIFLYPFLFTTIFFVPISPRSLVLSLSLSLATMGWRLVRKYVLFSWWRNSTVARHSGRGQCHSWIVHMSLLLVCVSCLLMNGEKNPFRWNLCTALMCLNHIHLWTETKPSTDDGLQTALNSNAPRSHCNESLRIASHLYAVAISAGSLHPNKCDSSTSTSITPMEKAKWPTKTAWNITSDKLVAVWQIFVLVQSSVKCMTTTALTHGHSVGSLA